MRKILILALSIFAITLNAKPNETPYHGAASGNFNDGWRFERFGRMPDGSTRDEPAREILARPGLDDREWRRLNLPHDWGVEGPFRWEIEGNVGKLPWAGIGWYRKTFELKDTAHIRGITFDGIMANAEIFINGNPVKEGVLPYGYSPFRIVVTPYLVVGKNTIAVRVNAEKWGSRWYPGAGIYRDVTADDYKQLARAPMLKTLFAENGDALVEILNPPPPIISSESYDAVICERNPDGTPGKTVAKMTRNISDEERARFTIPSCEAPLVPTAMDSIKSSSYMTVYAIVPKAKRWSPDAPNLYVLNESISSQVGNSEYGRYTTIGFRTLKFSNEGFWLNGVKTTINGVCQHHDLGALGAAFHEDAARRQIRILKSFGCNAIRTSHNPPSGRLLELCDEMGMLVQAEAFDAWKAGKRRNDYSALFNEWREKDVAAFVARDRNHPCVFMWSDGNEVLEQRQGDAGGKIALELTGFFRKYDPERRPVTVGLNNGNAAFNGFYKGFDILGYNYNLGNYERFFKSEQAKTMPFHGSETASTVSSRGEYFFPVKREKASAKNNERFQVSSYDLQAPGWGASPDQQFRKLDEFPTAFGEFVWTGFDYLGEPTPYNSDHTNLLNFSADDPRRAELEKELAELGKIRSPSRSSYFGIVDLAGFPKDRYYIYKSRWMPEARTAHLLPHWNWPDRIGEVTPVHLYTSGDEAELFLNGKSLGRKKLGKYEYRFRWDDVKYEAGELKAVVWKNGKPWTETTKKTTGKAVKLAVETDRSALPADGKSLAFLTVKVQDAEGLLVPRSCPPLKFEVTGGGEFVASDNGDATSFESFQSPERKAYNGLALGIVRAKKGTKEAVKVRITSPGLEPTEITINATPVTKK